MLILFTRCNQLKIKDYLKSV